jgi:hypothetical protein
MNEKNCLFKMQTLPSSLITEFTYVDEHTRTLAYDSSFLHKNCQEFLNWDFLARHDDMTRRKRTLTIKEYIFLNMKKK